MLTVVTKCLSLNVSASPCARHAILADPRVITHLRDLPHDISHVSPPDLSEPSARSELIQTLKELDINGSVEGRHTVLQAAALVPAERGWESTVWEWAVEDEWIQGGEEAIYQWIAAGLRDGVFDRKKWVDRALKDNSKGRRAKRAVVFWGVIDLEVSCSATVHYN
jgi:hypothetical protein